MSRRATVKTAVVATGVALLLLGSSEPAGAQTSCIPGGDPVPSLTLWGVVALGVAVAVAGWWGLRNRRTPTSLTASALLVVLGALAAAPTIASHPAAAQTTTFPCPTTTLPPTSVPPTTVPPVTEVGGAGIADGTLAFDPPGVPPLGAACVASSFAVAIDVDSVVVSTAETFFAGPLALGATGTSACEALTDAVGTLSGSTSGEASNGATLSCPSVSGTYRRAGYVFTAALEGACALKDMPTGPLRFEIEGVVVPDPVTAGLFTPVTAASFRGDLKVVDA